VKVKGDTNGDRCDAATGRALRAAEESVMGPDFFTGMVFLLWATVLFGFAKTYFLAGMVTAPLPDKLIHVHGAVFTLWMVLLAVQVGLVSAQKVKWHKQLGLAGFGLAVLMLVMGVLAGTDSLRRNFDAGSGLGAKTFYVIPLSGILAFALLVYLSYRARFKPAVHKRLILIATIAISEAAIARWPIAIRRRSLHCGLGLFWRFC
jgi:hypothetical protein